MSVAPGGGGFEVAPPTLIDAAVRSLQLAADVNEVRSGFAGATGAADASMDAVSAGPGWEAFCRAWAGATSRLAHSQETFAFNTEAAAVRYEAADEASMPPAPPVIPSPEDLEEAWDEACEPRMFVGQLPPECLMA
ncbi:MAG TPA: hypothetical protein VG318_18380 [Actinomycetota bacterium]|nr:hypothetical protein [Actinomycetota bacterium]